MPSSTPNSFEITGGRPLRGELTPQGAKNEALQVISAVLITPEPVTITNVPDILDVRNLIELIRELGVSVERIGENAYTFRADQVRPENFKSPAYISMAQKLRGSVMLMGPALARFGKAYMPKPGGDKIGRRRIDTHIMGFRQLGARFSYLEKEQCFALEAKSLKGTYILLDEASVTGTANVIMAAVLAKGETVIYNAACEPYVQQLCLMLVGMGAKIEGIGSNRLTIEGVSGLTGATHELLPDMIEVGSFIGLAAMTGSDITIRNCGVKHLGIIPDVFRRLGIRMEITGDDIHVPGQESYEVQPFIDGSILTISDAPWPGFTPDLLSVVLVVATQAIGSVLIHQKMFESRLFFVDRLIEMGAQIILCDPHRAAVVGLNRSAPLRGIVMTSPDIRAGVSLLIAALSAEGKSVIHNIDQIDRGYQQIDERLRRLGAEIRRI